MKRKRPRPHLTPGQALRTAQRAVTCCVLCGGKSLAYIGCRLVLGMPQGLWYGVCHVCEALGLDEVARRVEAVLAAQLN